MKSALLFIIILPFSSAQAQVIVWDGKEKRRDVADQIWVLEEPKGAIDSSILFPTSHDSQFHSSRQPILNFGFTNAVYWLKFTVFNTSTDSVLLELGQAFIPEATLYYTTTPGQWSELRSGYKVPLNSKPVIDHAQVFPIPPGTHKCYLRILPYVHAIPVRLWNRYQWQLSVSTTRIVYGIYIGVMLFIILISLLLYFILRRTYSIIYAVLVGLYIASSAAVMEGYAIYFFPSMDMMYWYRIVPVLDMPALLLFCISFLELRKYSGSLYRITVGAVITLIIYIIILLPRHPYLPLVPNLIINQVLALLVFLLAIRIGLLTGRLGNKMGYYFAASYSIWFILLVLEIVYIQVGVPRHISDISYVSIAIFIEAILLALLVVRRIQQERLSHQHAQFEMQARIGQMEQEFQHELLHAQLEVQEQIFDNISQDIHDNIGLSLVMVNMNLHMVSTSLSESDQDKLLKPQSMISKVLQELRDLARSLNNGFIKDLGLVKAITQQIQMVSKSGIMSCRMEVKGDIVNYPAQQELLLFRVIQELITNTIKHAEASGLEIVLNYFPGRLKITVADNGQGFDAFAINEHTSGGLGIRNMKNRIGLIKGSFHQVSTAGGGTITTIEIFSD